MVDRGISHHAGAWKSPCVWRQVERPAQPASTTRRGGHAFASPRNRLWACLSPRQRVKAGMGGVNLKGGDGRLNQLRDHVNITEYEKETTKRTKEHERGFVDCLWLDARQEHDVCLVVSHVRAINSDVWELCRCGWDAGTTPSFAGRETSSRLPARKIIQTNGWTTNPLCRILLFGHFRGCCESLHTINPLINKGFILEQIGYGSCAGSPDLPGRIPSHPGRTLRTRTSHTVHLERTGR